MATKATTKTVPEKYAVKVVGKLVNLRKSPDEAAKIECVCQMGDVLAAVGEADGWTHVDGGLYVMTRLVEPC